MNDKSKRIGNILKLIYGYGIMISVFLGSITVLAYIAALIIGGETAALICSFIYTKYFTVLILSTDFVVLTGLASMYFKGEKAMVLNKKEHNK